MPIFSQSMAEFKKQIEAGHVPRAYRGLMDYIRELRKYFAKTHPEVAVSASIYQGFMDMTYFALVQAFLRERNLKCPIVFLYDEFRFEIWLSGANRDLQTRYWHALQAVEVGNMQFSSDPKSEDYTLGQILVPDPDFSRLDEMTENIEKESLDFIKSLEELLADLEV